MAGEGFALFAIHYELHAGNAGNVGVQSFNQGGQGHLFQQDS